MKNYFKVIWRSFAKNAAKLISLTVIMALGIAFVAGLGTLSPTILDAIDAELEASSAPDFIIKSHSPLGFTEEQRDKIASLSFVTATDAVTVAARKDSLLFRGIFPHFYARNRRVRLCRRPARPRPLFRRIRREGGGVSLKILGIDMTASLKSVD